MRRKRSNLKQGRPWSARETKRFYKMLKFSGLNFVILEMLYNRAVTKGDDPKKEGAAAAAPSDGGSGSGSDGGSDGVSDDGDGDGDRNGNRKTSGKRRAPRRRQRKKEKMVHYRDAKAVWYLDVTKGAMLCLHK